MKDSEHANGALKSHSRSVLINYRDLSCKILQTHIIFVCKGICCDYLYNLMPMPY